MVFDKVVSSFGYNHTNLLSMMTLSVEHFHSTTHVKNVPMTQLQHTREFMRSIKEALKRCHSWSACYFTSRKASWYPPTENDVNFRDISPILPSKAVPSSITVADEETLRVCHFFITLQFNHIYSVCGKSQVSFITFYSLVFWLAMQDSHPNLYSTKTLYHLYISDPVW